MAQSDITYLEQLLMSVIGDLADRLVRFLPSLTLLTAEPFATAVR